MDERKNLLLYVVIAILAFVLIYINFFATIKTKVYFANSQASYLVSEQREVKKNNLYQNLIQELIAGPQSDELVVTIPPQTELLGIEVQSGVAKVNFSKELAEEHWGGTAGETMTVYSIVNTLTQFNEIDKVKILIDGAEIKTLAGHMELSKAIPFNSRIIQND
ncbi:MAG: GerMN domain-containing protein [Bacillota bacterium]